MILTDEELRAAYMAALVASRETSMAGCERDALRGVARALLQRLIADAESGDHTIMVRSGTVSNPGEDLIGIVLYKGRGIADWLRSKVKA